MKTIAIVGLILLGAAQQADAETAAAPPQQITVSSLLNQGYDLAGATSPASGGGGLYLRKGAQLYFCYVLETPQSKTVATRYCKPVE